MTYYLEQSNWRNMANVPEGMVLAMTQDVERLNLVILPALDKIDLTEQVIVDAGCGTGAIGLHALEKGAKYVYFLEQDPQMLHILYNTLPKIVDENKFSIIPKDIEHLTEDDFSQMPTLVTSEFYGPTLFDEGIVPYVRRFKSLFPNIKFIPENYETRIYLGDVDFSHPVWPADDKMYEQYKFMYSEKGFAQIPDFFWPENARLQNKITYSANDDLFFHAQRFEHQGKEQYVYCQNAILSHGNEQCFNYYGWYLPPSDTTVTYQVKISIDRETAWQPMLDKIG